MLTLSRVLLVSDVADLHLSHLVISRYWDRHRPVRSTRNQFLKFLENRFDLESPNFTHTDIVHMQPHQTRVGLWKESPHTWNSCSADNGENAEFRSKRNAATTLATRSCIVVPVTSLLSEGVSTIASSFGASFIARHNT